MSLQATAPEVPLPPIPPKGGLKGGMNRHELALRRLLLWKFLDQCSRHPVLGDLDVLRDFLTRSFGFNKSCEYAHGACCGLLGYSPMQLEAASEVAAAPAPKASWMDKMKAKVNLSQRK